jgi:hypothetical protein
MALNPFGCIGWCTYCGPKQPYYQKNHVALVQKTLAKHVCVQPLTSRRQKVP